MIFFPTFYILRNQKLTPFLKFNELFFTVILFDAQFAPDSKFDQSLSSSWHLWPFDLSPHLSIITFLLAWDLQACFVCSLPQAWNWSLLHGYLVRFIGKQQWETSALNVLTATGEPLFLDPFCGKAKKYIYNYFLIMSSYTHCLFHFNITSIPYCYFYSHSEHSGSKHWYICLFYSILIKNFFQKLYAYTATNDKPPRKNPRFLCSSEDTQTVYIQCTVLSCYLNWFIFVLML